MPDRFSKYSPRMWRWSSTVPLTVIVWIVFSTYVEVIPQNDPWSILHSGILHVCGGDPQQSNFELNHFLYSPRMWRWSQLEGLEMNKFWVFSTYVEVIPLPASAFGASRGILHVCGGDPMVQWNRQGFNVVFSTYVEVILLWVCRGWVAIRILHVCGGDPTPLPSVF